MLQCFMRFADSDCAIMKSLSVLPHRVSHVELPVPIRVRVRIDVLLLPHRRCSFVEMLLMNGGVVKRRC